MSEENFKQSRKRPTNPFDEPISANDPESIMRRAEDLAKNVQAVDPTSKLPLSEGPKGEPAFSIEGDIPPEFAAMFNRNSRAQSQKKAQLEQIPDAKPRLAYTNNPKLNELLAGIKPNAQYEEIKLPSFSKFYKNGEAPEDGVVHVRPMTGQEEEILGTTRFLRKGQAISMIFKNCVQERIQPEKWLTIDRTYLLIYLRGISYGPLYDVEIKCPVCANRFSASIDLDKLFVNYCPKNFDLTNLSGELPVTKYKFSYHLPTVEDENHISNYRERRQKDEGADDTQTWRMALLIEEIEGLNEHGPLMTLISNLPISDVAHLRNVLNDIPFGVDTKIDQWCSSCSETFDIELPFEANFFFPQPKKTSRIHQSN